MTTKLFVTATDTDAGKTFISQALLRQFSQMNKTCIGFKPIAAGCEQTEQGLRNEDALLLQQAASEVVEYSLVNPIAYQAPIAPHIAAELEQRPLDLAEIEQVQQQLLAKDCDVLLTEGAGGWQLPIAENQFLSDWVVSQQYQIILVVGMKLGCLNHAVLTYQAIKATGLPIVGWVANQADPDMLYKQQNLDSLKTMIDAPFWGYVPYLNESQSANDFLDKNQLKQLFA